MDLVEVALALPGRLGEPPGLEAVVQRVDRAEHLRLVDPVGPDGDPLTVFDNDYHLSLTSRCIDSGDNSLVLLDVYDLDGDGDVAEPDPIDLDAQARFADVPSVPDTGNGSAPIVDMGCYERQP